MFVCMCVYVYKNAPTYVLKDGCVDGWPDGCMVLLMD